MDTGLELDKDLDKMEANGGNNVVISVIDVQGARNLIQDFGRKVIGKRL
jgi:hypothetical protein